METTPLTEPTFFILLSLVPGPQHGYGIMKEVESLSDGRVRFSTGTLYGAIKRLLEQGFIERLEDNETGERGRKDYRLTHAGRRVLDAEVTRLRALTTLATQRLSGADAR